MNMRVKICHPKSGSHGPRPKSGSEYGSTMTSDTDVLTIESLLHQLAVFTRVSVGRTLIYT